jgi:arginase
MPISLTAFQGRAGDRNDLGISGALALGKALAQRLRMPLTVIGETQPALNTDWKTELAAAAPDLRKLAAHLVHQLSNGDRPLTVLNRCAAAIATIPKIVAHYPDACVVWFDAHADLNTPESSTSGYLGGLALSGPAGLWHSGFGDNLPLSSILLVGSRDLDPFEARLVSSGSVRCLAVDTPDLASAVIDAVAQRPVYIHLDCDVLEPGLVPTDFCVAGGLSLASLSAIFEALATTTLIGMEIAEFQYAWTVGANPASPAGLIDAIQPCVAALAQRRVDIS